MGFKVNTNVDALNAYYALRATTEKTVKSQLRLATGKQINHVWDDTSGFNIGKSLETKFKVMKSVQTNVNAAKDMLSTAESALLNIKDLLTTIETKISDASNPTANRESIARDITALANEIGSILKNTKYNDTNLLVGEAAATTNIASGAFSFQVSDTFEDRLLLNYAADIATSNAVNVGGQVGNIRITTTLANALSSMINVSVGRTSDTQYAQAILSLGGSGNALATFKSAIDEALQRIGNLAQRLDAKNEFLNVAIANAESNYSRLFDADFALEQLNVAKGQLMQQSGVAMLAQLNMAPQMVLQLFRTDRKSVV